MGRGEGEHRASLGSPHASLQSTGGQNGGRHGRVTHPPGAHTCKSPEDAQDILGLRAEADAPEMGHRPCGEAPAQLKVGGLRWAWPSLLCPQGRPVSPH